DLVQLLEFAPDRRTFRVSCGRRTRRRRRTVELRELPEHIAQRAVAEARKRKMNEFGCVVQELAELLKPLELVRTHPRSRDGVAGQTPVQHLDDLAPRGVFAVEKKAKLVKPLSCESLVDHVQGSRLLTDEQNALAMSNRVGDQIRNRLTL